ncbi:MAG TPA: phosphate ABC transporter ATP-binding protein PstB [Chthonomonadaceae bacterium]|nr:phosphate ABC transporter ATP-binding protein PstB [Chthonomonadaceae bacterium]
MEPTARLTPVELSPALMDGEHRMRMPPITIERPSAQESTSAAQVRITVRKLNFWYGKFQALKDVNLDVYDRQVTALIGPSGCGKSTFLRTLNRMNDLYPATRLEGSILLDGEDIYARHVDVVNLRKRVGMVFQRPNPFPMSLYDNVAYGPRLHGERNRARLNEIVERSLRQAALWDEVKDVLKKSALDLSGGQQQRLCIARVLAVEPEVLLMDEPASALDPNSTYRIEQLMEELKEKYTIIIVTHNLQQAARVSERTAFFLKGELIECGDTYQIFSQPRDRRTEDYVQGRFG